MANGQELAKKNIGKFQAWHTTMTDDDFREMEYRGGLQRKVVAKGCGFAVSVLRQNPKVRALFVDLEDDLRERRVLPPLKEKKPSPEDEPKELDQAQAKRDKQGGHLRRLEQENIELKAENEELKKKIERFEALSSALADVGRLPR